MILTLGQVGIYRPTNNGQWEFILVVGLHQHASGFHDYYAIDSDGDVFKVDMRQVYDWKSPKTKKIVRGKFAKRKMFGEIPEREIEKNKEKYIEYLTELNETVQFK